MAGSNGETMRILLANLKHLYQCRRLWVVYSFWAIFLHMSMRLVGFRDAFTVLVVLALPAAWVVVATQEDVASKPFCFCLPGHRGTVRRLILMVGLVVSIAGGLYYGLNCRSSDPSLEASILTGCLGLCFTSIAYLVATVLTFVLGGSMAISALNMIGLVVVGGFGFVWRLDQAILSHGVVVIPLGVFAPVIMWTWLGRSGWFRRCFGKPASVFLSPSVPSSEEEEERQILASVKFLECPPALDRYLLDIIHSPESRVLAKYIADVAYTAIVPLFQVLLTSGMSILWGGLLSAIVVLSGYVPRPGLVFILVLLWGTGGLADGSPLFTRLLPFGGRRERFYATLVFMSFVAVVSAVILTLPILMVNLVGPWLPDVNIAGTTFTFNRVSPWLPFLSLIVFPVIGLPGFYFHGRRGIGMIGCAMASAAPLLLLFRLRHVPEVSPPTLVLVGVLSWLIFALGLYRFAMRSDLVRR